MRNEENKSSSSSPPAKRPKMMNNCPKCPRAKMYTTSSRAEYKSLVLSLTCTLGGSSGQTSVRVPTQARVSNPQQIRINDASIPPGSSGQSSAGTQAHVSYPRRMGLYDALIPPQPNRYQVAQSSSPSSSQSLPYPFPPASVWPRSSTAGPSNSQASSSRPSLPSPPLPPSVPTILPTSPQTQWSPPSARLVPARVQEVPPSLPADSVLPSPPEEQGLMEPSLADIENALNEDDGNNVPALSLPNETGTSNGEPPQVLTNQASGGRNLPDPGTVEHGSNSLYENVAPQVHATLPWVSEPMPDFTYDLELENIIYPALSPSMDDLLNGSNYENLLSEGIAQPVHAPLPSENLSTWSDSDNGLLVSSNTPPPETFPYGSLQGGAHSENIMPSGIIPAPNDQQLENALPVFHTSLASDSLQQGTVPAANVPFDSSSLSTFYTYEEMELFLEQVGFGTVPSWDLNCNSYPSVFHPSTYIPSSSSTPANLPPGLFQG